MKCTFTLGMLSLTFIYVLFAHADELSWDFANQGATRREWEVISGDWEFKGGWWEVKSGLHTPGIAVIKEEVAERLGLFTHDGMIFEVTFDVLGKPGNQFVIFAYAPETDEDHVFQAGMRFQALDGSWSIERMHIHAKDAFKGLDEIFKQEKNPVKQSHFDFKLEIQGNTVIGYHKEREQIRYTFGKDRPPPIFGAGGDLVRVLALIRAMPVGRIGIANENAHTRFRKFKISGPGIRPRPVEPGGKLAMIWGGIKAQ